MNTDYEFRIIITASIDRKPLFSKMAGDFASRIRFTIAEQRQRDNYPDES